MDSQVKEIDNIDARCTTTHIASIVGSSLRAAIFLYNSRATIQVAVPKGKSVNAKLRQKFFEN
jgi:ribosomal protein L32E